MPSEAQRVAKLLALSVGVRYAANLVFMRQETLAGSMGGGPSRSMWPASRYDPTSEFAIMASLYFLANHADLLDKDTAFWEQVINLLFAWHTAAQFPKWVNAVWRPGIDD